MDGVFVSLAVVFLHSGISATIQLPISFVVA